MLENNSRPAPSSQSYSPLQATAASLDREIDALFCSKTQLMDIQNRARSLLTHAILHQNGNEREFRALIDNPQNVEALVNRIKEQLFQYKSNTPPELKENLIRCIRNIEELFLLNLEEAYINQLNSQKELGTLHERMEVINPLLKEIQVSPEGDPHSGGKQTCLLIYDALKLELMTSSGPTYRDCQTTVVYKPRDLEMEAAIVSFDDPHSAFNLLNKLYGEKVLPTYQVICKKDRNGNPYGFVEAIPQAFTFHQDSEKVLAEQPNALNSSERSHLYFSAGVLQWTAQLLGMTDLHHTNVMNAFSKERKCIPVPIDLETSFDCRVILDDYDTGICSCFRYPKARDQSGAVFRSSDGSIEKSGYLVDNPQDFESLERGFEAMQRAILAHPDARAEIESIFERASGYRHRITLISTSELMFIMKGVSENFENETAGFIELLKLKVRSSLEKIEGESYIDRNQAAIEQAFLNDRSRGDIPLFTIDNSSGVVRYGDVEIAKLPSLQNAVERRFERSFTMKLGDSLQSIKDAIQQKGKTQ